MKLILLLILYALFNGKVKTQTITTTKKFTLVVSRNILPGHSKSQVTINGTVPGPTINVTLGSWVEVCP